MTFLAVLAMVVAAPRVEVKGCADELFDPRVVRAQLELDAAPGELVELTCPSPDTVTLNALGASTRVRLLGATRGQRERTLSLFLSGWLRTETSKRPIAPPPPRRKDRTVAVAVDAGPTFELEVIPPEPVDAGSPEPEPEPAPLPDVDAGVTELPPDAGPTLEPFDAGVPSVPVEPTWVPIELALVPGVGVNRLFPHPSLNHLALGLVGVSSDRVDGLSLAPLSVVDDRLRGAQIGLVNVGGDVEGLQLGLLNIARSVRGLQVGLINVTQTGPASIGFLNANADHPVRLGLSVADTHAIELQLKSGGSAIYSLVTLGWVPRAQLKAGGGVGFHLGSTTELGWFAELELTGAAVIDFQQASLIPTFTFGFNLGYRILPRVAVLVGPRFSFLFGNASAPGTSAALFGLPVGTSGLAIAPGAQLGVEF